MPTKFVPQQQGDMTLDTQGDAGVYGMYGNTKPNLVAPTFCWLAQNKRFINGQAIDRGGHFCLNLLNLYSENNNGPSYTGPLGGTYYATIPAPKSTVYGAVEYSPPNITLSSANASGDTTTTTTPGVYQGMVFTGSNAYLVQAGTNATAITYPAGVTISAPVFAVEANSILYVFPGKGIQPMQYNQADTSNNTNFTYVPQTTQGTSYYSIAYGKWALWMNNRLWVLDDDTVHISNINDPTTYDPLNDLPIERGTNDSGVALYQWNSNIIIVFKQRSIYTITGIDDTLENIVLDAVDLEIGLTSPYAVVNTKQDMYFFGGDSVYTINQAVSTKLFADRINFADPIQPLIARINQAYANNAQMTIYNNRMYLAVPVDGATENNAVLVYNFLNQTTASQNGGSAWEGMDISQSTTSTTIPYAASVFNIQSWLYLNILGKQRLCGVSAAGYIFLYDYDECDMTDTVSALNRYPATSQLWTRGYCGTQQDIWGQTVGAGTLNKNLDQIAFHMLSYSPNYTVNIYRGDVNDYYTFASGQTYSNLAYKTWRKPNFTPSNVNNDFSAPARLDYSINLQGQGGIYLAPTAPVTGGIYFQNRQSFSLPYKVYGSDAYFMIQISNTGGNTNVSNFELSTLTKENTFARDT